MVVDTAHYDALGVGPTATEPELWSAFQKLVEVHHPDRNPRDPEARRPLQDACAAYLVLSDNMSRSYYDQFGRGAYNLQGGSVDTADSYAYMHSGNPFSDWIGDLDEMETNLRNISILRDAKLREKECGAPVSAEAALAAAGPPKEKGPGLEEVIPGDEGDQELLRLRSKYRHQRGLSRQEARILDSVERNMLRRIAMWTSTDRGSKATAAFEESIRKEMESPMSEILGPETLRAVGEVYVSQAAIQLQSKRFLGMGGTVMRMRDKRMEKQAVKGMLASKSATDAALTLCQTEEVARVTKEGAEDCPDEVMFGYAMRVACASLQTAWAEKKAILQTVVRTACQVMLGDENLSAEERLDRARALKLMGDVLCEAR